ncbi:hypothetical protein PMG71_04710 [Roseofilum sp. BLCC_M154]|uniref:Uncharacterized protein n=1 Tax=Roseofilum acuticapitatum BLCC-M154 TaxID=3022444 RepID=A0ABT7APA0_9CYAN|nr:hypothetical protein [Roseofilum acuticapitatum]MDJ1168721.1 hypothetical protein [Roseofilum acuticapitatum BLCC-M154]
MSLFIISELVQSYKSEEIEDNRDRRVKMEFTYILLGPQAR